MKLICAVKDLAIQAFGNPFVVHTAGEATRSFRDEVNRKDGQSAVAQHPEDYELYVLGEYDATTGELNVDKEHPALIVRAKDLTNPEN